MIENKKTKAQGRYYSSYLISWLRAGGQTEDFVDWPDSEFRMWLTVNDVTVEEQHEIVDMGMSAGGKFELETSAKAWRNMSLEDQGVKYSEYCEKEEAKHRMKEAMKENKAQETKQQGNLENGLKRLFDAKDKFWDFMRK